MQPRRIYVVVNRRAQLTGKLFVKDSHVDEMLRRGRCGLEVDVETLMMVDSVDMSDVPRSMIEKACRADNEDRQRP